MKILHTADAHIGETAYSRIDNETGLNARGLDFLNSFKHVADAAVENKVDILLVVGDFFTRVNPHPRHLYEVMKTLRRLSNQNITSIFVSGNHETPRMATTLNPLLFLEQIEKVHVVLEPETISVEDIDLVCVPTPSNFDEIKSLFEPLLQQGMERSKSERRVLAAHIPIAQAMVSSEKALEFFMGEDVDSRQIPPKFEYVALGHVHKFQQIRHPEIPVYYSGSSDRYDFVEEGEEKHAILVEIDDQVKIEPLKIPVRELLTVVDMNCAGFTAPKITQLVLDAIEEKKNKIKDALVRIKLERIEVHESHLIDWPRIKEALHGYGAFDYKIQPRTSVSLPLSKELAGEYIYPPSKELELFVKRKEEYKEISEELLRLGREIILETKERTRSET